MSGNNENSSSAGRPRSEEAHQAILGATLELLVEVGFSGLTVEDFRRRVSLIHFKKGDLKETVSVVEAFGRVETLDAHARSATIRLDKK